MPDYQTRTWVPEEFDRSDEAGPEIVVWDHVFQAVLWHAASDLGNEVAGFLLGHAASGDAGADPVVVVEAAVVARHVHAAPSRIEFTHDTWTVFHNERETLFGDMAVMGWYHTHPTWGIFLSAYDTFIHENFFKDAHHVALVVDPVHDHSGFFKRVGGELSPFRYYGFTERSCSDSAELRPGVNLRLADGEPAGETVALAPASAEGAHEEAPTEAPFGPSEAQPVRAADLWLEVWAKVRDTETWAAIEAWASVPERATSLRSLAREGNDRAAAAAVSLRSAVERALRRRGGPPPGTDA